MQGIGGASLSEHARCVSVLVIEVTMIVLMNNNHVNTIEEKELGIMWCWRTQIQSACSASQHISVLRAK